MILPPTQRIPAPQEKIQLELQKRIDFSDTTCVTGLHLIIPTVISPVNSNPLDILNCKASEKSNNKWNFI